MSVGSLHTECSIPKRSVGLHFLLCPAGFPVVIELAQGEEVAAIKRLRRRADGFRYARRNKGQIEIVIHRPKPVRRGSNDVL